MRATNRKPGFFFHASKRYCRKQAGVAGDRTSKEVAREKSVVSTSSGDSAPGIWVSSVRERYQSLGERRAAAPSTDAGFVGQSAQSSSNSS